MARSLTLITGASGGIGADLARVFARNGHDLALASRNGRALEALAGEIAATGRPRPLVFASDLALRESAEELVAAVAQAGAQVEILVNNAGFGLAGQAADLPRESQLELIDLNIRALADLTLRLLPQIAANKGRILNVASIVAFCPGPGMAMYYASKAFVLSFSQALSQELAGRVTVTALCPGATATGFAARAGFSADMAVGRVKGASALSVAEAGYAGLMAGRRVVVPGFANKLLVFGASLAPRAWLLPAVARMQAKRKVSA